MNKNLTNSQLDRKNILNNDIALGEIQKNIDIQGLFFEDKIVFTKNMLCQFYGVDERTIERYLSDNSEELVENGYQVLKGKKLKDFITTLKINNPQIDDLSYLAKYVKYYSTSPSNQSRAFTFLMPSKSVSGSSSKVKINFG